MKSFNIITAGSLALGFAAFASAQTDVYFTGSTAYRSTVVAAEIAILSNGVTPTTVHLGKTVGGASESAVRGLDSSSRDIIIHNHWTGSVAGVIDLTSANPLAMIQDSQIPAATAGANDINLTTDNGNTAAGQVSMADCLSTDAAQVLANANSTGKTASALARTNAPIDGGSSGGANGRPVASVDFEWILGSLATGNSVPANWQASSGGLTSTGALPLNITQDQALALTTLGQLPLSVITGQAADATSLVIYVGRNEDSGTRVAYQAESAANGVTGNKGGLSGAAVQWQPTQSGVGLPQNSSYASLSAVGAGITAIQVWPQNNVVNNGTINGWSMNTKPQISWNVAGHSGYNSGGDVAAILASPNPVTGLPGTPSGYGNIYIVSAIGIADAQSALVNSVGPNATALAYNGVPYSKANVASGQYALWNYEHLYYLNGAESNAITAVPVAQAAADAVADHIYSETQTQLGGANAAGIPGNIIDPLNLRTTTAGSVIE